MFKDTLHPGSRPTVICWSKKAGFTITELLVVIGIMGLLMMIGIPAFQSASRGGNMRTAIFQLNSSLALARQTAITTRQRVSVLFPDDRSALYSGLDGEHVGKAFGAYTLYGDRDGYLTGWRKLPQGVVFDPIEGIAGRQNIFLVGNREMYLIQNIPFPNNEGPNKSIHGLIFRPDGRPLQGGPTIYLSEGVTIVDLEQGVFENVLIREDLPFRAISVNNVTGQSRMREFFVEDRI